MRYRIKEYVINLLLADNIIQVGIAVPPAIFDSLTIDVNNDYLDNASKKFVTESVRLITDETRGGYVLMSTGQKGVVENIYKVGTQGLVLDISIPALIAAADGDADDIAAINAIAETDQFTIEFDWGESPEDLKDAAESTKQEIRNVAGSCLIPDFELPCLPFVPEGFCAIYGDADYMIGDFAPQTVAEQFEIGTIIHVTGDNATEEEFEGYPKGSLMAVAKTTLEPTGHAEGLYQDVEGYMQGITDEIIWQKNGYYRITGIVECYSEMIEDNISIFTYEELDPATLTDLAKQAVERASKSADMITAFFDIVETPDEEVMSETEAIGILEDTWLAVTGSAAPHTDDWDGSGSDSGSGSGSGSGN